MSAGWLLVVALAGGAGAVMRYGAGTFINRRAPGRFPWGTFAVNVSGCLLMGLLSGLAKKTGLADSQPQLWLALTTGLLGGYTTYSSFNEESLRLVEAGAHRAAAAYVVATLLGCAAASLLGTALGS